MSYVRALISALVLSLALVAAACGESEPAPLPTPMPPATPAPLFTPTPPATPVALPTPSPPATPASSMFPFTVIDSTGDEVTFEEPPERIVAFDSAAAETLFAIGEGHRVVATHSFVAYPPETAGVPRVGDAFNMDIEATVALEPDLVFIFSDTFLSDLERAGLKVLYLENLKDDFLKVADNVRMWGRITGNLAGAEAVAADFEARVERIRETMAPHTSGPSLFQDEGDLWTPGPDTLIAEVFELLKLRNIAHDISGYAQLSPEIIVEREPEIIIASYGDTISDNPAFKNLRAVEENRIFVPKSDALSIAGPRFVEGIEELAKWVYPDLFR